MIEDMYRVMNRITELKKRFGLMRHNQSPDPLHSKTSDSSGAKPGTFDQMHQSQLKNNRISSISSPGENEPGSLKNTGKNLNENLVNNILKTYGGEYKDVLSTVGGQEKITSPLENVGKPGKKLKYVNDIIQNYLKNIE